MQKKKKRTHDLLPPARSDDRSELCEDVGVVRLVDGNKSLNVSGMAAGTVLVKRRGVWGTVCDDGLTVSDAKVGENRCRRLHVNILMRVCMRVCAGVGMIKHFFPYSRRCCAAAWATPAAGRYRST